MLVKKAFTTFVYLSPFTIISFVPKRVLASPTAWLFIKSPYSDRIRLSPTSIVTTYGYKAFSSALVQKKKDSGCVVIVTVLADSSLKGLVILLVVGNALRKVCVSKKNDRTVRSQVSHAGFRLSMKSQFYHSSRFTSPFFNLIVYVCVCVFFYSSFSFRDIFFLRNRAQRFACRRSEVTTIRSLTACLMIFFFVQVAREKSRAAATE